jgi:uncharacterized integral membrane protein
MAVATSSGSKSQSSGESKGGRATSRTRTTKTGGSTAKATPNGSGTTNGRATNGTGNGTGTKAAAGSTGQTKRRTGTRTSEASASGATARARIGSRARAKTTGRSQAKDMPLAEPTATVPADDDVMAASNARRAISPDMPRVAWLRGQLQQMEDRQRERLFKAIQLTLIAIVFITFVLQNADGVNVTFLLFSVNIRLIWVIFGCGLLGGAAGYLIGRPDKSLRALLPQKEKRRERTTVRRTTEL